MKQLISPRARRHAWILHLTLAVAAMPLLGALIGLVEFLDLSPEIARSVVWGVWLTVYCEAPLVGYLWLLFGDQPPMPDHEVPLRSGSFFGVHWFEFASLPAQRLWTRDPRVACEIRHREPAQLPAGPFETVIEQSAPVRPQQHFAAGIETMKMIVVALVVGHVVAPLCIAGGWMLFDPVQLSTFASPLFLLLGTAASLIFMQTVFCATYVTVFWLAWGLWNGLLAPRRARVVRWNGTLLRTPTGSIDLDDPDLDVALQYTVHGAMLRITSGTRTLEVHGDHRELVPLADSIRARGRSTPEEKRRTQAALAAVQVS